jgi:hypothetical protein
MDEEVKNEIIRVALTITGLLSSNLFFGKAKPNAHHPYVVMSEVSAPISWDSVYRFESTNFQFATYAKDATYSAAAALDALIKAKFDFATVATFSGFTTWSLVKCMPVRVMRRPQDEETWQIIREYQIEVQKSR